MSPTPCTSTTRSQFTTPVRVAPPSSGFDWRNFLGGSGFGALVTIGLAWLRSRSKQRAAATRAELEAFNVRRMLRAAFQGHLTEPANTSDLITWARQAGVGFNAVTGGFDPLKQVIGDAPGAVTKAITDAHASFFSGSGAIKRVFNVPRGTSIPVNAATDGALRAAHGELRAAITALGRAMSERQRTSPDGYDAP